MPCTTAPEELQSLALQVKARGRALGFQAIGISAIEIGEAETRLMAWLASGHHGEMDYMARHGRKRSRPAELEPGTLRVISARMDYLPPDVADSWQVIAAPNLAFISRYALGRDYHKPVRKRLATLARYLVDDCGAGQARAFSDSAPVMEKPLAEQAGLGWVGKHSNLLARDAGSWFFLGEVYTDLPLPVDQSPANHCGRCTRCLDICPTAAIIAPYQVDARRCISYLSIELHGSIPEDLRALMGNRIYGCDDCQLVCPWNRFAVPTTETDFLPRHGLDAARLIDLFAWTEAEFLKRTEGSPIRRIGHLRWLRNIAVALGNGAADDKVVQALQARLAHDSEMVREHVVWALQRLDPENKRPID
jgi:epoxyqueuosine reductase